jgi:hypothetical protein
MKKNQDHTCVFPEIEYTDTVPPLPLQGVSRAMITIIRERGGWDTRVEETTTIAELEYHIRHLVRGYFSNRDDAVLQSVFHLVQLWGGEHGRYIYVQGPVFDWAEVGPSYRNLVRSCLEEGRTLDSLARKSKAFNTAMQIQGRRLGLSFITKHVHFWTTVPRGGNALPIFDNIIARGLKLRSNWEYLPVYWKGMEDKSRKLGISMDALERQLFNYFRWRNTVESFKGDEQ